tara:strand:+ start:690 stop:890 length:201 start_codon:yes stop_codon:yes gene_type:complete
MMIPSVSIINEKFASVVSVSLGKKSRFTTTSEEQLSYIVITLRETVSILFHNLFHRKVSNCGKHGK